MILKKNDQLLFHMKKNIKKYPCASREKVPCADLAKSIPRFIAKEKTVPFEMINGRKLYYETHGEGEPIVLLHHGFGCTKIWKEIFPSLVKAGYRVLMFDRRGYGRSEGGGRFSGLFCERSISKRECERYAAAPGSPGI